MLTEQVIHPGHRIGSGFVAGNEQQIVEELNGAQGSPQDIGGYYRPDVALVDRAMRPSATLNGIVDSI